MKRYLVVGLYRKDGDASERPSSAYVLVAQSMPAESRSGIWVEIDIEEAIEAFRRGWIELGSEIPIREARQ